MNANWTDFNNAESQQSFDVIPKGTIVPVRMTTDVFVFEKACF